MNHHLIFFFEHYQFGKPSYSFLEDDCVQLLMTPPSLESIWFIKTPTSQTPNETVSWNVTKV